MTAAHPIPADLLGSLSHVDGVTATTSLDVGQVRLGGTTARAIGVDPSAFRAWSPGRTAASDAFWQSVARDELTTSFDLGHNLALPLGGTVPIGGGVEPVLSPRLGALATVGLAGFDITVSRPLGARLGLVPGAGAVLSAPKADVLAVRDAVRGRLGAGYTVALLHEAVTIRDAGELLTRVQIATVLATARSRLGMPYVWGATGPKSFDCSGLVGYAFHAAGVDLPRTSQQQWYAGRHVRVADARPGDLLFWAEDPNAPDNVDHVAIYLGRGLMISAPHTGEVVRVAPVAAMNFRGIVRVDPALATRIGGAQWSGQSGL